MARIWAIYRQRGYQAASLANVDTLQPIPPPGWPARVGWRKSIPARGPVGDALQSARAYGMVVGWDLSGPRLGQRQVMDLLLGIGPRQANAVRLRNMLWGLQLHKTDLAGLRHWGPVLAKAQTKFVKAEDLDL